MADLERRGWAHVADGAVDQTADALPQIWENVLGFDLAADEKAAEHGWLPLSEDRPAVPPGHALDGPDYAVAIDAVTAVYTLRRMTVAELDAAVQLAKLFLLASVDAEFKRRVGAGWSYTPTGASAPLVIDIDADGRANLSGLALSALLAVQKVTTWTMDRGWIARGGTRIPFLTPALALPFALGAAAYYEAMAQHEQDLCDAAKAAPDLATLAAIDVTAGWPT